MEAPPAKGPEETAFNANSEMSLAGLDAFSGISGLPQGLNISSIIPPETTPAESGEKQEEVDLTKHPSGIVPTLQSVFPPILSFAFCLILFV